MPTSSRIRRVLVGYDGSRESGDALDLALDVGASLGAAVTVLCVLASTVHLETREARSNEERRERARLEGPLADAHRRASSSGLQLADVMVAGGDPAEVIALCAAEHGFDLVVIGSHGLERSTHKGLGRVVERLLGSPRVPVLVASLPEGS